MKGGKSMVVVPQYISLRQILWEKQTLKTDDVQIAT